MSSAKDEREGKCGRQPPSHVVAFPGVQNQPTRGPAPGHEYIPNAAHVLRYSESGFLATLLDLFFFFFGSIASWRSLSSLLVCDGVELDPSHECIRALSSDDFVESFDRVVLLELVELLLRTENFLESDVDRECRFSGAIGSYVVVAREK